VLVRGVKAAEGERDSEGSGQGPGISTRALVQIAAEAVIVLIYVDHRRGGKPAVPTVHWCVVPALV
jgi:hypothetical protein